MNKIILYGAESNLDNYIENDSRILKYVEAIVDGDINKIGKEKYGFIIKSKEYLKNVDKDVDIVITSNLYMEEIKQDINSINSRLSCISLGEFIKSCFSPIGYCNLCNNEIYYWNWIGEDNEVIYKIIGNGRRKAGCPICGSYDRERWQYYVIKNYTDIFKKEYSILHFAPEKIISKKIEKFNNVNYITGDIKIGRANYKVDITNIQFANESFDYIIANHVLEHIVEEEKAISELLRCIKKNGKIILSFPICMKIDTLENKEYTTESDRKKYYGQHDHVRLYGKDYKDRLEKYGLRIKTYSPIECGDDIVLNNYINNDVILICEKSV